MDQSTDLRPYREQYTYYARKLLFDLGLGELGQPERSNLLGALEEYVQQIVFNTILENLDDQAIDKMDKLMGQGVDQYEAIAQAVAGITDIDLKVADALALAYAQMLDETRQLSHALINRQNQPSPTPTP